jgi:hypothetical protein
MVMDNENGRPIDLNDDTPWRLWQDRLAGNEVPEVGDAGTGGKKARKALKVNKGAQDKAEVVLKITEGVTAFEDLAVVKRLLHEDRIHRERLAARLQKPFNEFLRSLPHGTYREKRALCILANLVLRKFGLALRCPKTGRSSLLVANPGHHANVGRFQLVNQDQQGDRVRTISTPELPEVLELIPEDLSRSVKVHGENWVERIKQNPMQSASPLEHPE